MSEKRSIFLVDDDLSSLQAAGTILKTKGYSVLTAINATQAASRVNKRTCNVAVLGISLPDMQGLELLSKLRALSPDILAIMLTRHSPVKNWEQPSNGGVFSYLEKPLDPDHLLFVIANYLKMHRLILENR